MTLPAPFDKLRLPVIGSPLFIVSGPELVIAQCKAGIIGSFPALNARPQTQVDEWLHQITEELAAHNRDNPDRPAAPYAVNQIVHKSNDRLEADMATCAKWQVPLVITSLGAREEVFSAVKGWGGISMHDVINDRFARKAIEKGASGLIPVAAGAGGHAGVLSPFALMQEIREWFDGLVALSGSIAHGRSILAAQALGAVDMHGRQQRPGDEPVAGVGIEIGRAGPQPVEMQRPTLGAGDDEGGGAGGGDVRDLDRPGAESLGDTRGGGAGGLGLRPVEIAGGAGNPQPADATLDFWGQRRGGTVL